VIRGLGHESQCTAIKYTYPYRIGIQYYFAKIFTEWINVVFSIDFVARVSLCAADDVISRMNCPANSQSTDHETLYKKKKRRRHRSLRLYTYTVWDKNCFKRRQDTFMTRCLMFRKTVNYSKNWPSFTLFHHQILKEMFYRPYTVSQKKTGHLNHKFGKCEPIYTINSSSIILKKHYVWYSNKDSKSKLLRTKINKSKCMHLFRLYTIVYVTLYTVSTKNYNTVYVAITLANKVRF